MNFNKYILRTETRNIVLAAAMVFAAAVLSHVSSLRNEYVMDDFKVVVSNEFASNWDSFKLMVKSDCSSSAHIAARCGARPLTLLSWLVDTSVYKNRRMGYHVTNIALHGINSLLVFYLAFMLFKSGAQALPETLNSRSEIIFYSVFAGLIFALHPLQAEAVNVVSFRGDLVVGFLYVLSIVCLVKGFFEKPFYYIFPPVLMVIGLFAKETMVSFPLACFLCIWLFAGEKMRTRALPAALVLGSLTAAFLLLFWVNKVSYNIYDTVFVAIKGDISPVSSPAAYFNTVLMSVTHYARMLFAPIGLSVDYQFVLPGSLFNAASLFSIFLIVSFVCAFALIKNNIARFGLGLMFAAFIPVSNIFPLTNTAADRYMYIPMAGFALTAAWALQKAPNKAFRYGIAAALTVLLLCATLARNSDFVDMYSLYSGAIKAAPENPRARYNFAIGCMLKGDYTRALEEFSKTSSINPLFKKSDILLSRGDCYQELGDARQAKSSYVRAMLLRPSKEVYGKLAKIVWDEGNVKGTEFLLQKSIEIMPDAESYNNLGTCYARDKEYKEAAVYFRKAVNIQPHYNEAWFNLIEVYQNYGSSIDVERETNEMAYVYAVNGWKLEQPKPSISNPYSNFKYMEQVFQKG